jgi:hypothetical protein
VAIVTFSGQLTEFQPAEDAVLGGHPKTEAILNDMAEILLRLFVPWSRLLRLFVQYGGQRQAYSQIWASIEQTLTPYNRNFASNIELLWKSKEDYQADAKLRQSTNRSSNDYYDRYVDELESANSYPDSEEENSFYLTHENFNAETLIAAYHSINRMSHEDILVTGQRIPAFICGRTAIKYLRLYNLQQLDISDTAIC